MLSTELTAFAAELEIGQRQWRLKDRGGLWRPSATPATDLGYKCERRIVYHRTKPEHASPIGAELASIFAEGDLHQTNIRIELAQMGHEVVEAELNFRDTLLEITGTIDGKLEVGGDRRRRAPLEIKSSAGSPPRTQDAMRDHPKLYGRYYSQLQTYLVLTAEPEGLFLIKAKLTGLWSLVPCELDYDHAEGLLAKAERVRDHVRAETLPEQLADRSECIGCPWQQTVCHPEEDAPDPTLLAVDAKLETQLEEREGLDPARKRYAELDKNIKERFKMTKGDQFICGDFVLLKKPHGKGTRLDIKRTPVKGSREMTDG